VTATRHRACRHRRSDSDCSPNANQMPHLTVA